MNRRERLRHDLASQAAAHIVNLHLAADSDAPRCEVFFHVFQAVLAAMTEADSQAHEARTTFSQN